ncbi:MAG: hypothetical protein WCQ00_03280 [bacterium]
MRTQLATARVYELPPTIDLVKGGLPFPLFAVSANETFVGKMNHEQITMYQLIEGSAYDLSITDEERESSSQKIDKGLHHDEIVSLREKFLSALRSAFPKLIGKKTITVRCGYVVVYNKSEDDE